MRSFLTLSFILLFSTFSSAQAPVANPQSVNVLEDSPGYITLTGTDPNGDPITFTVITSPSHGTLSVSGPNVTYNPGPNYAGVDFFDFIVNDGSQNSAPATITITVINVNDPPSANSATYSTVEDAGPLSITLTGSDIEGDALTYSIISGPAVGSLTGTPPSLNYAAPANYNGTDSFIFRANDGHINGDSPIATVTINIAAVNDPPVANCRSITGYLNASGNFNIVPAMINNGSTDDDGIVSMSVTPTSLSCANLGANNVTLTVYDAQGLSSTCIGIVTIMDSIRPSITSCASAQTILVGAGCTALIPNYTFLVTATDNCGVPTLTQSPAPGSSISLGATVSITVQATDASGNASLCVFNLTAVGPEMNVTGNALSIVDGDVTPSTSDHTDFGSVLACTGTIVRTYTIQNTGNANLSAVAATITGTNASDFSVTVLPSSTVTASGTTTLQVTFNPSSTGLRSASVNIANSDCNENPYNFAIQGIGNADVTSPVFTSCPGTITVNADSGICTTVVNFTTPTATDNCPSGLTVTQIAGLPSGSAFPGGMNTVTFRATDGSGNFTDCSFQINVYDNTAPVAVCSNITAYVNSSGTATIDLLSLGIGSSDNCACIASRAYDLNNDGTYDVVAGGSVNQNFSCPAGTRFIPVRVTDCFGLNSFCVAQLTILDTFPPAAVCQNITVNLNTSGSATILPIQLDGGSSDACGIASRTLSQSTFTCANIGANNVILTVTDVNGNSSTCTSIVTVVDTVRPVVNTQNITLQLNAAGTASIIPAMVNNGSTDACGIASMNVSPNSFSCANIGANTVTFTVTDVNGNSRTGTTIVTVADTVRPLAIAQNVTATLSGGTATVSAASVNNGSTDACGIGTLSVSPNTFTCANLGANTVTLTVTDVNGNTSTTTAVVTVLSDLTSAATANNNVSCFGGNNGQAAISTTGGAGPFTYAWSPSGGTGATSTGLSAGTYTVTATDGGGCTTSSTVTITQPAALSASSVAGSILCNGGTTTVTVSATGGTPSYSGAGTFTVPAGTSSYTITDANGCISSTSITITEPTVLTASSSSTSIACNGGTATVTVVGAGGTALYTGAGSFTVNAGTYSYTVTDANGCTATTSITLTEPALLTSSSSATSIACNGGTATVTVVGAGGTSPYIGEGTFTVTSGTYSYTITDANGCTTTTSVTVTEPTVLTASSSATSILCNGDTSTVTVTASGGVAPYSGAGTFNQVAGTYTFTVTDNNGCTTTTSLTITEPTAISTSVTTVDVLCNGDSSGSIDLNVTGGTGAYTFSWNSGAFTTEDLVNIPAGLYSGVLTDANGCQDSGTVVINEPAVLAATAVIINPTGCTTNDGSIDLSIAGGTPGYVYVWSTTATTEDVTALDGGVFTVTVTDTNGCSVVETFTLTEPGAPTVTFSAGLDTVCQSTTAPFTLSGATPVGGVFAGSGMINDTVFDPMMANQGFNVITYTYTDAGGCTGTAVDSILVDICTGFNSQIAGLNSQVSIFPNPNNGAFTVITSTYADMMIYDAQGKLVAAQKVQASVQNQINIESSGMYLITIVAADGNRTTQRVVVTK
jgi:hypothetical protein